MKALKMSLVALALLAAVPALAKESREMRSIRKALNNHGASSLQAKPIAPQCANFAGKWEGICRDDDGETYEETMSIDQDGCQEISFDGIPIAINGGGVTLQSTPSPDSEISRSFSIAMGLKWNDSQTRLHRLASLNIGHILGGSIRSSVWLAGDRLRIKDDRATDLLSIDGTTDWNYVLSDCTYERVQN